MKEHGPKTFCARRSRLRFAGLTLVLTLVPAVIWGSTASASKPVPPPPTTVVTIQFDDGVADQYGALSALNGHGMHATFYVNTGVIGDAKSGLTVVPMVQTTVLASMTLLSLRRMPSSVTD